jgi:hypothetical protein
MCGIEYLKKPKRIFVSQEKDNMRHLKEEQWEPLRVHLDFSLIENNLGKFKKQDFIDLKEKIMPKTRQILEKLLKVKRISGKLKLNHESCESVAVPEVYLGDGDGVDADIVIFVTIDDTGFFLSNRIEAAATHCLQHSLTRRPIAGYIQFKPDLKVDNKTAEDYMVWLAIHEITHILVMNDSLYEDWIDANVKPLGMNNVVGSKILENGKKMSFLKTPKIIEKGKAHYGCDKFEGLPLEYNGGPGTVGAHWSKRYVNTDYMIGDSYGENLISELTLAMFEDSGWYKADYSLANLFLWGKGQGCDFLNNKIKCVNIEDDKVITTKFNKNFCTNLNYPVCSTNNIFRANCRTRKYKNLFSYEQYFGDKNRGGIDILSDKCPIPIEVKNGQSYYGGSCRVGQTKTIKDFEKVCPECACFMSNLKIENNSTLNSNKKLRSNIQILLDSQEEVEEMKEEIKYRASDQNKSKNETQLLLNDTFLLNNNLKNDTEPEQVTISSILKGSALEKEPLPKLTENDMRSHCFEFKCEENNLYVTILGNSYKCNEKVPINIPGFKGKVQCPPSSVLCHNKFKCKFGCVDKYKNN